MYNQTTSHSRAVLLSDSSQYGSKVNGTSVQSQWHVPYQQGRIRPPFSSILFRPSYCRSWHWYPASHKSQPWIWCYALPWMQLLWEVWMVEKQTSCRLGGLSPESLYNTWRLSVSIRISVFVCTSISPAIFALFTDIRLKAIGPPFYIACSEHRLLHAPIRSHMI